ncbi:MAG: beta-lactamase family protein [Calditrichaeota bacterium]|nr:beta-lactamase family protein [Calditrichota bacterium]
MNHLKNIFLLLVWLNISAFSQDINPAKIVQAVDSIRIQFHIPGLAFGVSNCDSTLVTGALGIRKINSNDSVTINDKFHIASLGKGLFAFITGKLVDEGKLSWDTRFFDMFPEMKDSSRQEYLDLKLSDLLSMRTRLRSLNNWDVKQIIDGYNAKYSNDRFSYYKFARYALALEPVKYESGQFYNYTSMGYVLACLMIEKASRFSYSQLLNKMNNDLGLEFFIGWPLDYNENQPSGHLIPAESGWGESKQLEVLNGDRFTDWGEDFLFYNIPSGHHSISALSYLKYLQLNLRGLTGQDNYLKSSTYDFIFNGAKEYSMGWGNDIVNGNNYYSHNGSAGNYFANAIIIKEPQIAIAVMANAGNGETKGGMLHIINYLKSKYVH